MSTAWTQLATAVRWLCSCIRTALDRQINWRRRKAVPGFPALHHCKFSSFYQLLIVISACTAKSHRFSCRSIELDRYLVNALRCHFQIHIETAVWFDPEFKHSRCDVYIWRLLASVAIVPQHTFPYSTVTQTQRCKAWIAVCKLELGHRNAERSVLATNGRTQHGEKRHIP